ncbi:hypothetical protein MLD38_010819 [Melastoma candidum]|nr:hypothetical protein MLD38_010819 [Melastoma candidum]
MFDAAVASLDGFTNENATTTQPELFLDSSAPFSTCEANNGAHQIQAATVVLAPPACDYTNNLNYLSPFIENKTVDRERGDDQFSLECLTRQDQSNDWVESQECSNYLFWESSIHEETLCGDDHFAEAPAATNTGLASLPSFPTSM